jgi:ribose/xylose/arabinose/galactoside ABC-type transport system permease subunit
MSRVLTLLAERREYGVGALLVLTMLVVGLVNHGFLAPGNLRDLLIAASQSIIIACGLTLVMVMGEIDISMGSLTGLLAALMGLLASTEHLGWPVWAVVLAVLAAGALVGALNGLLVTVGRVPSIIATLGTLTLLAGAGELLMGGESISGLPDGLRFFAVGYVLGVPTPVAVAVVCVTLTTVLCRQTPLGRRIYAVGSNPHAARLAGLPAVRLKVFAFAFTGLLTAIAALVAVPQQGTINSGVGKQLELLVVTGVVVGGTAISGGRGTIIGSALALLLLGMVGNVLIFLQLGPSSTYWERAIQGAFILGAVLVDHVAQKHARAGAHA